MNKIILITGVSSGLGQAMAHEALHRGDVVVGTVRRQQDLDRFEAIAPRRSIGRLFDLTDTTAASSLLTDVEGHVGPIDVLINNAGYGLAGVIEELDLDDLRRQFDVNVIGQIAMIQAALPGMRTRRRGHIVTINSMGGIVTFPVNGAYHGTKFALLGMSDTLAQEVKPLGIHVTSVLPGYYNTDGNGRSRQHAQRRIADYDSLYANVSTPEMSGDPARLASLVMDATTLDRPPTRLLVGHSAVQLVRETLAAQAIELDQWAAASDTDGDG